MGQQKAYTGILAEPLRKWTALTTPSDDELSSLIDDKFSSLLKNSKNWALFVLLRVALLG
jgi:hypothetical protein